MVRKKSSTKNSPRSKPPRRTSLTNSAFWWDLETRFRELQPDDGDGLRAEWDSMGRQWQLRGTPGADVSQRFDQNAEYAAKVGFNRRSAKSSHIWLELLKRETHAFHVEGKIDTRRKDEKMRHSKYGSIQRVCEVSATYCQRLGNESHAEELELARAGDVTQDAGLAESQGDAAPVRENIAEAGRHEPSSSPPRQDEPALPQPADITDGENRAGPDRRAGLAEAQSSLARETPDPKAQASAPSGAPQSPIRGERDTNVAARRTELRNMLRSTKRQPTAREVCTRWDFHNIPLPDEWQKKGFKTWTQAYDDRAFRQNVKKLVSTDIRRVLERRS